MQSKVLQKFVNGRESFLIESFIVHGPESLKDYLEANDQEWELIFEYLVFEHNLIYRCVASNLEFFTENYIQFGMSKLREILNVTDLKFDAVWEPIFDLIAIANEGLGYHVMEHRERYVIAFKARGADFVRKVLGLWKDKYDDSWSTILDIMLNAVCEKIFSENTFDRGLQAFTRLVNDKREHRLPIFKQNLV